MIKRWLCRRHQFVADREAVVFAFALVLLLGAVLGTTRFRLYVATARAEIRKVFFKGRRSFFSFL
jgi:hypothetical protein